MSRERFDQYERDYPKRDLGKHPNGRLRRGCRRCGKELESARLSFCSDACREDVLVRCGVNLRHYVAQRDKTYCARCGIHVKSIEKRIREVRIQVQGMGRYAYNRWIFAGERKREQFRRYLARLGLQMSEGFRSLWEAHHKHAVKDGGGGCGLDGYETLCIWCHKRESAEQQRRWAEERAQANVAGDEQTRLF